MPIEIVELRTVNVRTASITALKARPRTNATATSTKLPLEMNSLNSLKKLFTSVASRVGQSPLRPLKHARDRPSRMSSASTTLRPMSDANSARTNPSKSAHATHHGAGDDGLFDNL